MVSLMCSTPVFSRSGNPSFDYVWDSVSDYMAFYSYSLSFDDLIFSELLAIKNMCDFAGIPFTPSNLDIFIHF